MRRPPRMAEWLLDRFVGRESLRGDITEEYGRGRSPLWYWKQVLLGIVIAAAQGLSAQKWMAFTSILVGKVAAVCLIGLLELGGVLLRLLAPDAVAAATGMAGGPATMSVVGAVLAGSAGGWAVARVHGGRAAAGVLAFATWVAVMSLPSVYGPAMSVLDHFGGLWLLADLTQRTFSASIVGAEAGVLIGGLAGASARQRSRSLA